MYIQRHLCKPAITGIIGLLFMGFTTLSFVIRLCEMCVRCLSCSRWVMDVSLYCSLQISQPFIHPQQSTPPPEQLSCSTPIDSHCHIPVTVPPLSTPPSSPATWHLGYILLAEVTQSSRPEQRALSVCLSLLISLIHLC